jgi:hypothetical protein
VSVDEIVAAGGDADDVLRAVVAELVEDGCAWAGIWFAEGGHLELGPEAGIPDEARRLRVPIVFRDERVGELGVDGGEPGLVERVAAQISPWVLLGWDTGGEAWTP